MSEFYRANLPEFERKLDDAEIHIISPKSLIDEFPAEHGNIYGTTATFGTPSAQLSGAEKWDTAKVSKIRW